MRDLEINLGGEKVLLLPEHGLYWPRTRTLFISDTHFGKSTTTRRQAAPAAEGSMASDLERLSAVITRAGATRLIVLGDLLHAHIGRKEATLRPLAEWRAAHADLPILLVRGNHDRRAGDPPADWRIDVHDPGFVEGPFTLQHEPLYPQTGYALAGHLHPGLRLSGPGRQLLKIPCFWFRRRIGVLPAFSSFAGTEIVRPRPQDRVYVVGDRRVFEIRGT